MAAVILSRVMSLLQTKIPSNEEDNEKSNGDGYELHLENSTL
jgi:hypothetical protein